MPRYYCDYCDTYLTHDSPAVRKQHNAGYKHKANVRNYYMQFEEQHPPNLLDSRVKEYDQRSREAFQAHVAANFSAMIAGGRPVGPPPVRPGAPGPRGPSFPVRQPGRPPARPPFGFVPQRGGIRGPPHPGMGIAGGPRMMPPGHNQMGPGVVNVGPPPMQGIGRMVPGQGPPPQGGPPPM